MKKIFSLLLLLFAFVNCSKSTSENKSESDEFTKIEEKEKFDALAHQNLGIVLTDLIKIYDSDKNVLKEVKGVFGEIVQIDSITKEKFNLVNSNDRCRLHNFVKVKGNKISGWIYGEFLFEKEKQEREIAFTSNSIKFNIIPTKNFGIGAYDEEAGELSFCKNGTQNPILFYTSLYSKYDFLPLNPTNENYSENYLTLDSHDGWVDEIKNYSLKGSVLTLEIFREYQEGYAIIMVEVYLNEKQSTCKVVQFKKNNAAL